MPKPKNYDAKNPHPIYLKAARGEYLAEKDIATLVRHAVIKAYPGTKFSVRTKTYSGGGSVTVHWHGGPIQKTVETLVNQFRTQSFDGTIDMAHDNDIWLAPDGTASMAHDQGTVGSGGCRPEIINSTHDPAAVICKSYGCYIFCTRYLTGALLQTAADRIREANYGELADFKWDAITIEDGSDYGASLQAPTVRFGERYLSDAIYQEARQIAA